jgi:hypothetical protein
MDKAKGAPGNQRTGPLARDEWSKTLHNIGISYGQSSRWQKIQGDIRSAGETLYELAS